MSPHSSASSVSSTSSSNLLSRSQSPPEVPPCPYVEGAKFVVYKHEPPTTFEMGYCEIGYRAPEVPNGKSHLDWCLAHPPHPGATHTEDERCIEIAKVLRGSEACGAQTVLTTDGFVAKFYDPIYYDFHGGYWPDEKVNVTAYADRHYITEAGAYSELRNTSVYGDITPTYYGSWTMNNPTLVGDLQQNREVRLIIIEYISGMSMFQIDPETLTSSERERIMIQVIEASIDLHFVGIAHDDFEPRNIMLSVPTGAQTYDSDDLRVCVIDYAVCGLLKDRYSNGPSLCVHNPLFWWPGADSWSDWGWLPPWEEAVDWMWTVWKDGGKGGKYVTAVRDPDSPTGLAKTDIYKPSESDTEEEEE